MSRWNVFLCFSIGILAATATWHTPLERGLFAIIWMGVALSTHWFYNRVKP